MLTSNAWNPQRLARARRESRLSQEALAHRITEHLGRQAQPVRARNIVRWEKGRTEKGAHAPHTDFIAAIAAATDKDVAFFFSSDEEDEEAAQPMLSEEDMLEALRPLARLLRLATA